MTTFLNLALTGVIAVFTVLIWRTYNRLNWLVGAQMSHSNLLLQVQAQAQQIKLVWWDPTQAPWPTDAEHGKEFTRQVIYIGMPENLRKGQGGWLKRARHWLAGGAW